MTLYVHGNIVKVLGEKFHIPISSLVHCSAGLQPASSDTERPECYSWTT